MTARGFTLVEVLGALAISAVVLSSLVLLLQPALDLSVRLPESADLAERGRAAEQVLRDALEPAGSGADLVGQVAWTDVAPAVWPRRLGRWNADVDTSAWPERFTVTTVPWLAPQAPLAAAVGAGDTALTLAPHAACGADGSCGFRAGDHLALIEPRSGVGFGGVTSVAPLHVEWTPGPSVAVGLPAIAAAVDMQVFYFDATRRQLRRYDGLANDQPVIDDVVWMSVRYYADPAPPTQPAMPGEATCVVQADGLATLPLLGPVPAPLVELGTGDLSDGPWCGQSPWRFDADLLRVRAVRVRMRLEAASAAVRGLGAAFQRPGGALRPSVEVPDLELDVFVAPRVLRGG